jgi:nucleotide-binding universal stress UspA family protein
MAIVLLINDPYHHTKAKERALTLAKEFKDSLLVLFVIDPAWLDSLAYTVAEQGWLGSDMKRRIGKALKEGLHLFGRDVLTTIKNEAEALNIPVTTTLQSGSLRGSIDELIRHGHSPIIVARRQNDEAYPDAVEVIEDA